MIMAAIIILVASGPNPEWRWIWATPDYIRPTNVRTWSSDTGDTNVDFQGNRFTTHLENEHQNPAYDLTGEVRGNKVAAMAKATDSDDLPKRCDGTITRDAKSQRIDLVCEDGEFIGLIRKVP